LTVVKAFIRFIEHQPGAKLYMIYQTTELLREIEDLAEENVKWKESICLIGKIPHDQLGYWYNSADFIISGSYYEGSGVAVCEAMSCGCIPILTDIVSFRKMTGPGKCGLLYKAGDEEELLSALLQTKKLDKDKERARVLEQFQKELSFEAIAREIHRVITSL
jgi:glycosyltransferase involved in cell wall biosynthesis